MVPEMNREKGAGREGGRVVVGGKGREKAKIEENDLAEENGKAGTAMPVLQNAGWLLWVKLLW